MLELEKKKTAKSEKTQQQTVEESKENTPIEEEEGSGQIEETEENLAEKVADEVAEFKDKLLRTMAEFDNYKRRTAKEKDSIYDYAVCDTIGKLLPVLDTLKLSLQHAKEETPFKQGVEMVVKQFTETLDKMGVKEIKAVGEPFDPNFHNAVMHVEDDKYGEKEIIEEFQTGFILKDKVIRFSMVKVAN